MAFVTNLLGGRVGNMFRLPRHKIICKDHHDPWMSFTANSRRLHYFMSWRRPSHKSAKPGHHVEKHSPATPRPSTTASPASKDSTDMELATFMAQDPFLNYDV